MYTISAHFAFAEQRPMTYWWPLVCEAMRCQGLSYENPHYLPVQVGDYYFHYDGDMDDKHEQSFRQMWDDLHDERCRCISSSFWSQAKPYFEVMNFVYQDEETQEVSLDCGLSYLGEAETDTPEADTIEATRRIHLWLEAIREIYRLCGPCTVELTHERYGYHYRIGTIGKPLVLEWGGGPTMSTPYEGKTVQERLPDGAVLSVVTPLRLPWRGDELPITLQGEESSQGAE